MTKDKDIFCKKLFQLTWKQFAQTKQRRYKGIHVFVHFYLQPKLMQVKYTVHTHIYKHTYTYIHYSHKRNEWKTEASTRTHTRKTAKDFKHGIGTARLSFLFSFKNIKLSTYILYMKHVGSFFFPFTLSSSSSWSTYYYLYLHHENLNTCISLLFFSWKAGWKGGNPLCGTYHCNAVVHTRHY